MDKEIEIQSYKLFFEDHVPHVDEEITVAEINTAWEKVVDIQ